MYWGSIHGSFWVHEADLQPKSGRWLNHVAVDEIVIQLDDEQYWLYTAVDPRSNDLIHTNLKPTRTNVIADQFFAELHEKHDVGDEAFSLMARLHFSEFVTNLTSISDTNDMEIGTVLNVSFVRQNAELPFLILF
jgi:hypothetical protein